MSYPLALVILGLLAFVAYLVHIFVVRTVHDRTLEAVKLYRESLRETEVRVMSVVPDLEKEIRAMEKRVAGLENVRALEAPGARRPFGT